METRRLSCIDDIRMFQSCSTPAEFTPGFVICSSTLSCMPSINPSRYLKLSSSSGASDRALPVFSGVPIRNLLGSIWSGLRFREFGHRASARKHLEIESGSVTSLPRDQLIQYLVRHAGTHV